MGWTDFDNSAYKGDIRAAINAHMPLAQLSVKDKDLTAPPGSESEGDQYIVAATATGDWAGKEGQIARYSPDSDWDFLVPAEGYRCWVDDEDVDYIYSGSAWDLDISAQTDAANEWTKTQNFNATTLTDAANISWDLESNQVCSVTLTDNRTLDNPTNLKDGATYTLIAIQDGTGSRTLAYGTAYKWPGGTTPTLSTAANAIDVITFTCDGTNMLGVFNGAFA